MRGAQRLQTPVTVCHGPASGVMDDGRVRRLSVSLLLPYFYCQFTGPKAQALSCTPSPLSPKRKDTMKLARVLRQRLQVQGLRSYV